MLLRCFGGASFSLFFADRCIVANSSFSCIFRRHHGHYRKTSSRFKWPYQGYMPSRTPYQLFPAISTPDDAKEFVSYLTKKEKLLLLPELQKLQKEKDFDGLWTVLQNASKARYTHTAV